MRRFAAILLCSGILGAPSLVPSSAQAEPAGSPGAGGRAVAPSPSEAPAKLPRLVLALGTELLFGMNDVRVSTRDDVAISSMVLVGGSASAVYRVVPALAIGLRGGGAWDLDALGYDSSGSYRRSLWQLAATGRYQPAGGSGWYGSARAGVAAIVDRVGSVGSDTVTQWAPLGGVALGYDFWIDGPFTLGLELQGSLAGFAEQGAGWQRSNGDKAWYRYGTSSWLGLGLVGSLGF